MASVPCCRQPAAGGPAPRCGAHCRLPPGRRGPLVAAAPAALEPPQARRPGGGGPLGDGSGPAGPAGQSRSHHCAPSQLSRASLRSRFQAAGLRIRHGLQYSAPSQSPPRPPARRRGHCDWPAAVAAAASVEPTRRPWQPPLGGAGAAAAVSGPPGPAA